MKKIVAIVGSPKPAEHSVTASIVNSFLGLLVNENKEIQAEMIVLSEKNILPCKGCMGCSKKGICKLDDDFISIKTAMKEADLLIFASPVHFNHVSSIFQNFIERSLIELHTFDHIGKPFINFITTNGSGETEADKYLTKIGLLFGAVKIGSVIKIDNDKFNEKNFNKLATKVNRILTGENKVKPKLMNKLYFSSMKSIIKHNEKYFQYETKVWKERNWI
jgi:multimeric flavodoxin WrbA